MTTPADPLLHSPSLKAVFHMFDQVVAAELHDIELPNEIADRVRRRIRNRLLWGHPDGLRPSVRGPHYDRVILDEVPRMASGLMGAEVTRELIEQGVLPGPAAPGPQGSSHVPREKIFLVSSSRDAAENYHREHIERLPNRRVVYITARNAEVALRGAGGPASEVIVLDYPDDHVEDLVRIIGDTPGTKLTHVNA